MSVPRSLDASTVMTELAQAGRYILAVGGRQRPNALDVPEWHSTGLASICLGDLADGTWRTLLEYESPPEVCADDRPSILFKAATLCGDHLYVCTQTEILIYRLPGFERVGYLTHPWFNDVHHVRPRANGNLLIANTGLDMVLEMTTDGEVVEVWNVLGEDPWARFDPAIDYRKVVTTKPHLAHPNFVFALGDPALPEIWATRFEQRDAVLLDGAPDQDRAVRRLAIDRERPHDGVVHGRHVYFTTVDGHIVAVDADGASDTRVSNLNTFSGKDGPLGWCRGLDVWDDERVLVGFSRLRPTRFRQNLRWLKRRLGGATGTLCASRLALYDLAAERLLWESETESAGLNVIFSCFRLPDSLVPAALPGVIP